MRASAGPTRSAGSPAVAPATDAGAGGVGSKPEERAKAPAAPHPAAAPSAATPWSPRAARGVSAPAGKSARLPPCAGEKIKGDRANVTPRSSSDRRYASFVALGEGDRETVGEVDGVREAVALLAAEPLCAALRVAATLSAWEGVPRAEPVVVGDVERDADAAGAGVPSGEVLTVTLGLAELVAAVESLGDVEDLDEAVGRTVKDRVATLVRVKDSSAVADLSEDRDIDPLLAPVVEGANVALPDGNSRDGKGVAVVRVEPLVVALLGADATAGAEAAAGADADADVEASAEAVIEALTEGKREGRGEALTVPHCDAAGESVLAALAVLVGVARPLLVANALTVEAALSEGGALGVTALETLSVGVFIPLEAAVRERRAVPDAALVGDVGVLGVAVDDGEFTEETEGVALGVVVAAVEGETALVAWVEAESIEEVEDFTVEEPEELVVMVMKEGLALRDARGDVDADRLGVSVPAFVTLSDGWGVGVAVCVGVIDVPPLGVAAVERDASPLREADDEDDCSGVVDAHVVDEPLVADVAVVAAEDEAQAVAASEVVASALLLAVEDMKREDVASAEAEFVAVAALDSDPRPDTVFEAVVDTVVEPEGVKIEVFVVEEESEESAEVEGDLDGADELVSWEVELID